jgi:hypothetical protein
VLISVTSPPETRSARRALRESLLAIRGGYRRVRVVSGAGRRIAGKRTESVVLSARNRRGVRLRIIAAAAQGRRRAWLVHVFAAEGARARRLAQGQVALQTLRLRG